MQVLAFIRPASDKVVAVGHLRLRRSRIRSPGQPSTLTVEVGETVTWVWDGAAQHNVVGEGF